MLRYFTQEEWVDCFRLIEKNVSNLLKENKISVFSDLSIAAISLSPHKIFSLSDFCMQSQFDEISKNFM